MAAVNAVKAGRVDFKLDKNGNVAVAIGKASFDADKLADNGEGRHQSSESGPPGICKRRLSRKWNGIRNNDSGSEARSFLVGMNE